jgi:hypothetical protein
MFFQMFGEMKKILGQMTTWLDAADAHAKEKKFESSTFLAFRLAPDQLAFARQVQIACDTTKMGASRLTGKEAPSQPDTEATTDELRARIKSAIAYLDGFNAKDFDGAATRVVTTPRWEGKVMTGQDYFLEHVTPNFFFHAATAYSILRHNGVNIGKKDYLGPLTLRAP